ncbi:MAG: DNA-binding protein [Treponema sp. CETP13]|nr:MAG: DNA-binding protein [Treponema sp. CETP13]
MAIRGELYTQQVVMNNRSYFFNVKENRTGDIFLQIVESKSKNGEVFERRDIVVFDDDIQKFLKGLESSLDFIGKTSKARSAARAAKKAEKKRIYAKKNDNERKPDGIKRTGKIHIVSKRKAEK